MAIRESRACIVWIALYPHATQDDPAATPECGEPARAPQPTYIPNKDGVRLQLPDDVQMLIRLKVLCGVSQVRVLS